ncbi:MAG: aldehyde ferredoxin oxidoreductase family protein [Spirochaetes bacterium]|nr:aldehyde ferredoxin oxidoreductase family protein [Spirochaetota bacterium]
MYAVTGNLLEVELARKQYRTETIPEELYDDFLGGYGLGAALLMKRMDPKADPLGPDNIIGFASGYLTGTGAYIASRFMVFGKSPSTKGWGDSNSGGYFGKKLKQAGFDVVLLRGISDSPVYILLDNGKADILPAEQLWGKDTYETEDMLKIKHGKDCEIVCIGPAGEKLSLIAGISTDKGRFAARSGLGAVMGSKKVKAIVAKGKIPINLANPQFMKELRKKHRSVFKELAEDLSKYGTPMFYQEALFSGDAPVKNWAGSVEDIRNTGSISAENYLNYQVKRYACSGCPIGCGGHLKVENGEYKTESTVHKVEYETTGMFGSNLLNDDIEALIKINDICNRYGMDTIGCGGLCAFAMEAYEKGIIDKRHTGGLELNWGNSKSIVSLVELIGRSEGIGGILAKGFEYAAETFGGKTAGFAIAVRNEAFPAHDPRWSAGLALTYYSDATPSRHTQGSVTFPIAGYEQPDFKNDVSTGRAKYHNDNVNLTHALNAAGLCLFGYITLDYLTFPDFLKAADGKDWTLEKIMRIGFRIHVLRHLFNRKAGISFKKHSFPERVLGNPPLKKGPNKGVTIDLDTMVDEYLKEINFDSETGEPLLKTIKELNLEQYIS